MEGRWAPERWRGGQYSRDNGNQVGTLKLKLRRGPKIIAEKWGVLATSTRCIQIGSPLTPGQPEYLKIVRLQERHMRSCYAIYWIETSVRAEVRH